MLDEELPTDDDFIMSNEENIDTKPKKKKFSNKTKKLRELKEGDIIWAKHRGTYYPAMLRVNYTSTSKVTVTFICEKSSSRIRMTYARIVPLDDSEESLKIMRESWNTKCNPMLTTAMERLRTYHMKLDEEEKDDFLVSSLFSDGPIIPFYRFEETSPSPPPPIIEEVQEESSNEDSLPDLIVGALSEEEEEEELSPEDEERKRLRIEEEERIVAFIRSAKCKRHMAQIMKGKLSCQRHKDFLTNLPSKLRSLKYQAWVGPLLQEERVDEMNKDFVGILAKMRKYHKNICDPRSYYFDVYQPEAVRFALKDLYGITDTMINDCLLRGFDPLEHIIDELTAQD